MAEREENLAVSVYQFWLKVADADVYKFLKYFTFLSIEEIDAIEAKDQASGTKPEAPTHPRRRNDPPDSRRSPPCKPHSAFPKACLPKTKAA